MTDSPESASDAERPPEPDVGGDGWSGADIEEAYLRALQAMEDVPWQDDATAGGDAEAAQSSPVETAPPTDSPAPNGAAPDHEPDSELLNNSELPAAATAADPAGAASPPVAAVTAGPRLARGMARAEAESAEEQLNVSPTQVIEAALF